MQLSPFLSNARIEGYLIEVKAGRPTTGGGALPAFSIRIIRQWSLPSTFITKFIAPKAGNKK